MEDDPDALYACALSLEAARASVVEQTGLLLEEHESSFWGGVYFRAAAPDVDLVVHLNADVMDGEPVSTSAVPTSWTVAVVGIPGLILGSPWRRVPRT